MCYTNQSPHFLLTFKGLALKKNRLGAVLACLESNFSNFKIEYLRENKFFRKTILAYLSGAQKASIHEIKNHQKSRDTAPLLLVLAILKYRSTVSLECSAGRAMLLSVFCKT